MTLLATAPDRKADFFRNPRVLNQSAIVIGTDLLENNEMEYEDAVKVMTRSLRNKVGHDYGYDVYLPTLIRHHLTSVEKVTWDRTEMPMRELSPVFYAAAWDLCRRGILRPGVKRMDAQATQDGSSGNGYSITPFGLTWLGESDRDDFVPTEPERFGRLLSEFRESLGAGFQARAQEAVRCYGAHAYLACCAMCGAAAESILLRVAATKEKDEESVLRVYASAGGRAKTENVIIGRAKQQVQTEFKAFTMLLNYWRDAAAHGRPSGISDNEAYTALVLVLRFAHYVRDHWDELVAS